MLRWFFYTTESQTECQKKQAAKDLFNRLMISDFKKAVSGKRQWEVGKNSQYFKSAYNKLGVEAGFNKSRRIVLFVF